MTRDYTFVRPGARVWFETIDTRGTVSRHAALVLDPPLEMHGDLVVKIKYRDRVVCTSCETLAPRADQPHSIVIATAIADLWRQADNAGDKELAGDLKAALVHGLSGKAGS